MNKEKEYPYFWFKLVFTGLALNWALHNLSLIKSGFFVLFRVLAPFVLGFVLAFIFNIPISFFEERVFNRIWPRLNAKYKRLPATLLTLLILAGVLSLIVFTVVPELNIAFKSIISYLPKYWQQTQEWLQQILSSWQLQEAVAWVGSLEFDINSITERLTSFLQMSLGGIFSSTIGVLGSVFSGAVTVGIGFVFAVYMIWQKEELYIWVKKVVSAYLKKEHSKFILETLSLANTVFADFISGQVIEAFILGTMFFVGMLLFRFPYALAISVFIGFTSIVPVFGAFLGFVIGFFLIFIISPVRAFWFVVLFFVMQQIEGNLIYPKVMGARMGLPSLWVLLAVTLGSGLFGIWGILFFIPLTSVLYQLLNKDVDRRLAEKEYGKPESETVVAVTDSEGDFEKNDGGSQHE